MEALTPDVIQSVILGVMATIYGGGKYKDIRASRNGGAPLTRDEHNTECEKNLKPILGDIKGIREDIRSINQNILKIAAHHGD